MRDLEQRLGELEGRHNDLTQSYESLQVEYSSVKQEMDKLRQENERLERAAPGRSMRKGWENSKGEILDPVLFDVSAFCFDQENSEDSEDRK